MTLLCTVLTGTRLFKAYFHYQTRCWNSLQQCKYFLHVYSI